MKKVFFAGLTCLLFLAASAKVTLFLQLDRTAKEPRVRPEVKCEDGRTYADELIEIVWEPASDGFHFQLTNKGKVPLTIPWEECSFVNENGATFRVIHGSEGKSVSVEPESQISDVVAPVDYMTYGKEGWGIVPVFQEKWSNSEFESIANKDLVFKVLLTVKKDRIKNVYSFTFKAFAK